MSELEELRKQLVVLNGRIWNLEDAKRAEENANLEGKCFRYRNCYSCPKDESEYWWLYRRVTSVGKDGRMQVFQFQTDQYGKTEIEFDKATSSSLGEPITLKQFRHAFRIAARMINDKARKAGALA